MDKLTCIITAEPQGYAVWLQSPEDTWFDSMHSPVEGLTNEYGEKISPMDGAMIMARRRVNDLRAGKE